MPASYRISAYDARPPLRERLAASGLSIAIIVALVLALLWATTAQFVDLGDRGNALSTFDVSAPPAPKSATKAEQRQAQPQPQRQERIPPPPPAERAPPPPPVPVPVPRDPSMIVLTREDFAASDIGRLKSKAADPGQGKAAEAASAGGGGKPVYGPSEMGGRTLYAADWYREPTRAEMAPYMPERATEGWGIIACQTAERYRVENCRELGQSPGSGIARGLRQAAWQFLVIPPSINGKPQIGAWVRIRYDIIRGIEK